MSEVQEVVAELLERVLGLDCHECLGRGYVAIGPSPLDASAGFLFVGPVPTATCSRCHGTGKEGA